MPLNKIPERRSILLVDKKTQLKYVALVTAVVIGVNILVGFCIYFSVSTSLGNEYSRIAIAQKIQIAERIRAYQAVREGKAEIGPARIEEEAELLSDHLLMQLRDSFRTAQIKLIPILLLLLLVVIFEGIAISNRIVGPIYHVERSLTKLGQGDLVVRTVTRKKDEFKSLSDKVNYVSDQWGHQISALKRQLGRITDYATALKQALGKYNPEMETQISTQADQILKRVTDCNNVLARFTVPEQTQKDGVED